MVWSRNARAVVNLGIASLDDIPWRVRSMSLPSFFISSSSGA